MSIKVLLVDGSDVMRSAIWRLFKNELGIEVIGTATSFAETIALTAALTPDVLLMDPQMPDERQYTPKFVKSQILLHTKCIVAISLWNDADTKTLAKSFGAHVLLDKMNLYSELIPAIKQFCTSVSIPKTANSFREDSKWPAGPSTRSYDGSLRQLPQNQRPRQTQTAEECFYVRGLLNEAAFLFF